MAKRFTDTEKFSDTWYRKLTILQKCIWEYLLAECNHAGIFENFDYEMMSFKIGAEITKNDLDVFRDRIQFIKSDVLFIPKFIEFQYGTLNPQSKVHTSVLKELKKYNIDTLSIEYGKSIDTLKDKDKDKDKVINEVINVNPDFNFSDEKTKLFDIYKKECNNLTKITFENRNNDILGLANQFLEEIEYDFDYYKELCRKANILKKIVDKTINFKMLIKNHIGIMNGSYERQDDSIDAVQKWRLKNA